MGKLESIRIISKNTGITKQSKLEQPLDPELRDLQFVSGNYNSAQIVADIQQGENLEKKEKAEIELYDMVGRIVISLQKGHNSAGYLKDLISETYTRTLTVLRENELRIPDALSSFITITGGNVITEWLRKGKYFNDPSLARSEIPFGARHKTEQRMINQKEILNHAMDLLDPRDREILNRSIYEEQSQEEIMKEMNLSETQYRLHRSRAIGKLGKIGKYLLDPKNTKGGSPLRKRTLKKNTGDTGLTKS